MGGDESIIQADDTPYADDMIEGSSINENYIGPDNAPVAMAPPDNSVAMETQSISDRARTLWNRVTRAKKKLPPATKTTDTAYGSVRYNGQCRISTHGRDKDDR